MSARVLAVVSRQGAHSLRSLRIVQVQQVSLPSFGYCTCSVWTTIGLSVYLSVLAASAGLQHLTTSFCPDALLWFSCYTVSHRLASMGVRSAVTCLGEHTISPTSPPTSTRYFHYLQTAVHLMLPLVSLVHRPDQRVTQRHGRTYEMSVGTINHHRLG